MRSDQEIRDQITALESPEWSEHHACYNQAQTLRWTLGEYIRPASEAEIRNLIKILEASDPFGVSRDQAYALRWALGEKEKTPVEMRQAQIEATKNALKEAGW